RQGRDGSPPRRRGFRHRPRNLRGVCDREREEPSAQASPAHVRGGIGDGCRGDHRTAGTTRQGTGEDGAASSDLRRRRRRGHVRKRFGNTWLVPFLANVTHDDLLVLKELAEAGKLRPVIDRQYPLTEAAEAVRYVGTGQARAKVVIDVA